MADQLNVSQELLQLEYDDIPNQRVSQILSQIEYDDIPNLKISHILVQVEYVDPNDVVMDCPMFIVT